MNKTTLDLTVQEYKRNPSERLSEQVLIQTIGMVKGCAKQFGNTQTPAEDLLGVAQIGVLKALEGYCPGKRREGRPPATFGTYAYAAIEHEIWNYLYRENTGLIYIPESARKKHEQQNKTRQRNGQPEQEPTYAQIRDFDTTEALEAALGKAESTCFRSPHDVELDMLIDSVAQAITGRGVESRRINQHIFLLYVREGLSDAGGTPEFKAIGDALCLSADAVRKRWNETITHDLNAYVAQQGLLAADVVRK